MKLYLLRRYVTPDFDTRDILTMSMLATLLPIVAGISWVLPSTQGIWTAAAVAALGNVVMPQRPSAFETTLPISGRDIALVRFLSALALFELPVVVAAFTSHLVRGEAFPAYALAQASVLVLIALLLPRFVRHREFSVVPGDTLYPVLPAGIIAGFAILLLENWLSLALLIAAATVAGAFWWRNVPPSFESASRKLGRLERAGAAVSTSDIASNTAWWKVLRPTLWAKQRTGMVLALVITGAVGIWQMYSLMLMMLSLDLWGRQRWVQSMPLSHRARLWMILGPGLVIPLCAVVLGIQIHIPGYDYSQGLHRGAIDTNAQESKYYDSPTRVSLDHWTQTSDSIPVIRSPWGETAEPYVVRVFNGVYYNPYTTRMTSSDRFVDWQYARATTAVFGVPLERKNHEEGQLYPRRITQSARMTIINSAAALCIGLVLFLALNLHRWHGARNYRTLTELVAGASIIAPTVLFLFTIAKYTFQQGAMNVVVPLIERQLLRLSGMLPENIALVGILSALPVLMLYALLERQFSRSENLDPPPPA